MFKAEWLAHRLDGAVRYASGFTIAGRAVHPYRIFLNLAVVVAGLVGLLCSHFIPGFRLRGFLVAFAGTYVLYEAAFLPVKARLTGVRARSLLLDLLTFFLPAYLALSVLQGGSVGPSADALALVLPAMVSIVRVGCFLSGCCYGRPATWGVVYDSQVLRTANGCQRFTPGEPPDGRVLPVQLVESAGNLAIFAGLLALASVLGGSGRLFVSYMLAYGVLRFVVDFWRASSALKRVGQFSAGQVLALGMVAVASTLLLAGI